jgi:hypothetical protein
LVLPSDIGGQELYESQEKEVLGLISQTLVSGIKNFGGFEAGFKIGIYRSWIYDVDDENINFFPVCILRYAHLSDYSLN